MVWYHKYGWFSNPFELKPMPDLISGFDDIKRELLENIKSGSCCLLQGEEGSGKTILLKWLEKYAHEEGVPIYINTSGMSIDEIRETDIDKLIREAKGLLGSVLNKDKKIIMLVDEAQTLPSALAKTIKRNLDNQVIKSVVLASKEDDFEILRAGLLGAAAERKINMRPMTQEEANGMISKRVGFKNPFEAGSLEPIITKAGFKPKAILETCELIARENVENTISKAFVLEYLAKEKDVAESMKEGKNFLTKLSPLQRKIVLILKSRNSRPVEIASKLAKPTKTITAQLAYLSLKNKVDVMKRKGIKKPVVEKEEGSVYKLSDEVKEILS